MLKVIYFDSFGVELILQEIKEFIGYKNIKITIFRIQANNSIICGCFCIRFIDFMFAGKTLIDYASLLVFFQLTILKKWWYKFELF